MELARSTSHGGFSLRGIFTFALTVILTALLAAIFVSTPTHAAGDVSWNGNSLIYENNQYGGGVTVTEPNSHGIPKDSTMYQHTIAAGNTGGSAPTKAYVIYFAPGQDPGTATTATYREYDFIAPDTYSNPINEREVTVDAETYQVDTTACVLEGIGYIICPVITALSTGMDWIFDVLSSFVAVRPLSTDTDSVMYQAWATMRTFANIAFVIAFTIIIYSQITNVGISNYGIKKLIPRLILAAVLVNVSYWICVIAIDLSNLLGYGLQNIFVGLRDTLVSTSGENGWSILSWENLGRNVLSGGALALAAGGAATVGLVTTFAAFDAIGIALLLLPILLGAFLTVLVVLLVLAARQAIITLLVIVAPLAFVAYLLPNTEKLFEKWRGLFTTMLVFFPAFSLVFGGAQFAGIAIIQNASDITVVILGMAVQIAPLAITPLLLKLSGSLLGKIAGIINNPRNGILDKAKAWSRDEVAYRRARTMERNRRLANTGQLRGGIRRMAVSMDNRERRRKGMQAVHEENATSLFNQTSVAEGLHEAEHRAHTFKERVDNANKKHLQKKVNAKGSVLYNENLELENSKVTLDTEVKRTAAIVDEFKAGEIKGLSAEVARLQTQTLESLKVADAEVQRGRSAQYVLQKKVSEAFTSGDIASNSLLQIAKGVDPAGLMRARSNALAALNKLDAEAMENNVKFLSYEALRNGTTVKRYSAQIAKDAINGTGAHDTAVIAAAFQAQANEKNMSIFEEARGSRAVDQEMLSKIIVSNDATFKGAGGYHLQDDLGLRIDLLGDAFEQEMAAARVGTLANASATGIPSMKFGWVADFADPKQLSANIAAAKAKGDMATLLKAYTNVKLALTNEDILSQLDTREEHLRAIEAAMADALGQEALENPNPPLPPTS